MEKETPFPANNEVRFAAFNDGISLMRANFTDHAFERHSHEGYAIGVTAHGTQRFQCKGQHYDSQAGELVLFNPDEDHDGNRGDSDGFGYAIWYLPESFVHSCVDADAGVSGNAYFSSPHVSDPALGPMFGKLTQALLTAPRESLQAETLMRSFLAKLLARHGERPQSFDPGPRHVGIERLERVKDYIRTYYQQDLTVSELAAVAGLSRAHLTRAFSAAFRTSPHVYLNTVRIAQAQMLIRHGMPLAMVAGECGFADQSHLARRFKGSVGTSPAEWRRALVRAA